MPAFNPHQRGYFPFRMNSPNVLGGARQRNIFGIANGQLAHQVDLIHRALHSFRSRHRAGNPDGKKNRTHAPFAHARNIDCAVWITRAQIKVRVEKALGGVVVRIDNNGAEVQVVGFPRDVALGGYNEQRQNGSKGETEQQETHASEHPDCPQFNVDPSMLPVLNSNVRKPRPHSRLQSCPRNQLFTACINTWPFTAARDSVSGIPFGHTFTQFCALSQSSIPPSPINASSLPAACIAPVGCMLNRRTWLTIAAPTKWECLFTFGQISRQSPQVMQRESG